VLTPNEIKKLSLGGYELVGDDWYKKAEFL